MPPVRTYDRNGHQTPEYTNRPSPPTAIDPIVRDGVGEIASNLVGIGSIIESLNTELSPDTARAPGIEELLQEIAELHGEVKGIKVAQDTQIRAIRDEVKDDTKKHIVQSMQDQIEFFIADTIAAQVKEEMKEWSSEPSVTEFIGALQSMVEEDDALYEEALIQLENSRSRHANSTLDVQDDFDMRLRPIKRRDGGVSEHFPISLRELFSYDAEKLVRLIKGHNLRPLGRPSENLNRFLIFIGINASIPDQFGSFLEERPPAYPRDTTGPRGERIQKPARRRYSTSEESVNTPWYSVSYGSW